MSLLSKVWHFFEGRPAYKRLRDPEAWHRDEEAGDVSIALQQPLNDEQWRESIIAYVNNCLELFGPAAIPLEQLQGSSIGTLCASLAQSLLTRLQQTDEGYYSTLEALRALYTAYAVDKPVPSPPSTWKRSMVVVEAGGSTTFWVNLFGAFELLYLATLFVSEEVMDALFSFLSVFGRQLEYLDASEPPAQAQRRCQPAHWIALTSYESSLSTQVNTLVGSAFDTEAVRTMDFLQALQVACIPRRVVQALAIVSGCAELERALTTDDANASDTWQFLPIWPMLMWQQQQQQQQVKQ